MLSARAVACSVERSATTLDSSAFATAIRESRSSWCARPENRSRAGRPAQGARRGRCEPQDISLRGVGADERADRACPTPTCAFRTSRIVAPPAANFACARSTCCLCGLDQRVLDRGEHADSARVQIRLKHLTPKRRSCAVDVRQRSPSRFALRRRRRRQRPHVEEVVQAEVVRRAVRVRSLDFGSLHHVRAALLIVRAEAGAWMSARARPSRTGPGRRQFAAGCMCAKNQDCSALRFWNCIVERQRPSPAAGDDSWPDIAWTPRRSAEAARAERRNMAVGLAGSEMFWSIGSDPICSSVNGV
jgi:hypothetical protein